MTARFAQPVLGTFAGYIVGLAANLVVSILVARILGPAGAGLIVLAMNGPGILALVGNLGLARSISHFLRRRPFSADRIVGLAAGINVFIGLVLAGGYIAALAWLGPKIGLDLKNDWPVAVVAALIIPFEIALQDWMAVCQGYQNFSRRTAILLTFRWLYAALAAAGLLLLNKPSPLVVVSAGLSAYILTIIVATSLVRGLLRSEPPAAREGPSRHGQTAALLLGLLAGAAVWLLSHRLLSAIQTAALVGVGYYLLAQATAAKSGRRWRDLPVIADARLLTGYAWRTHVSAVILFLIIRSDIYLVSALLGDPAQVGLYSRAGAVAETAFYFLLAVENVLFPVLSGLPPQEIPAAAAAMCRRGLLAGAALVLLFEAASHWLIVIPFGPEFAGSIAPLRILLPGVLAIGFVQMLNSVFNSLERPWPPALVGAVGLVTMLALDFLWIPPWGITGAALASLVAYTLTAAILAAWFSISTRRRFTEFFLPTADDLRVLSALFCRRCRS
jgi:O-antigen/teichoic acid export membrane protein